MTTFSEIVDAADRLSVEEQEALIQIVRRRIADQNRASITQDVAEGRAEFECGQAKKASVAELMDEARGES